jgi:carbamoyl-phosphate synthase small subunit
MTGYQEILTDPSYRGQIVAMTYPHIGNYGVNAEDVESSRPWMSGFVVREISRIASNFRSRGLLEDYLAEHNVPGIADIDTRRLTRVIRSAGAMRGVLSSTDLDDMSLVRKAQASPGLLGRDLVREVVAPDVREWTNPLSPWTMLAPTNERVVSIDAHIVALDFGMKWNICRHLAHLGARVTVMPGTSRAHEVMRHDPAGVFLSNGPGDPEPLQYAIECVRELLPQVPIFGICLGHQILALACGAKTFKLKFGHRGANQPVMNLETKQVEITSQNHGFSVEESTLPSELVVTHRNLNDGTVAGVRHLRYPAFSVQYHPEASAGPHDSHYHFRRFAELLGGRCLVG